MNTALFASPFEIFAGLLVGILFGFLLQKATVTRFATIVGQLILKDFTVMKVILTAIASGSLGLYLIKHLFSDVALVISTTTLLASFIGGGLFGIGMAILGYCPGTCVGALGEKSRDAIFGLLGMILGAGLYAQAFGWIKSHLKPDHEINQQTLAHYFNLSPWLFIALACVGVWVLIRLEKPRKKPK